MSINAYWMQCGACGGDTMSFLSAENPDAAEVLATAGIDLLWHPSLSNLAPARAQALTDALCSGAIALDVLIVEGVLVFGPNGSGGFDLKGGRPKKDIAAELARRARYVIAAGTCAAYGGFGRGEEIDARGLQFTGSEPGGLLEPDFRSGAGLPVINLAGCPVHPAVLRSVLTAVAMDAPIPLDAIQRPADWYGTLVHQGCTRNEYHEYRVEEHEFGEKGCLFFHMGCHGPLVGGPCNKTLWNEHSSKPRAGVPCFGCTDPDFPQHAPFFETRNIEGVPLKLPRGVDRAHYLAYKGMAAAAAPLRLIERKTGV